METVKLYSMIYDTKIYGNDGLGDYLGEFKHVRQLREDFYVDDFLAVNIETNELCLILSREIKGVGGGIAYTVHPVKTLGSYTVKSDLYFAEWQQGFEGSNNELPRCSNCHSGVHKQDAALYCPFCGALMKNPMRL